MISVQVQMHTTQDAHIYHGKYDLNSNNKAIIHRHLHHSAQQSHMSF